MQTAGLVIKNVYDSPFPLASLPVCYFHTGAYKTSYGTTEEDLCFIGNGKIMDDVYFTEAWSKKPNIYYLDLFSKKK